MTTAHAGVFHIVSATNAAAAKERVPAPVMPWVKTGV